MIVKDFLSGFVLGFLFGGTPIFADKCVTIDWSVSEDSNAAGIQAGPRLSFGSINQKAITFTTVPESVVKDSKGRVLQSVSTGCFQSDFLKTGNENIFDLAFVWTSGPLANGTATVTFTLEKSKPNERVLCQTFQKPGDQGKSCKVRVQMSLSEIDPEAAAQIAMINSKIVQEKAELARLTDAHPTNAELEEQLNEIAKKDFEDLIPEELRGISSDLDHIASIIESLKESLEDLRKQSAAEFEAHRKAVRELNQNLQSELEHEGLISSDSTFQQFGLEGLKLPEIGVPSISDSEHFDPEQNVYVNLAHDTFKSLKEAADHGYQRELDLIIEIWTENVERLGDSLQTRLGSASIAEQQTFSKSVDLVKNEIQNYIDEYGFLKSLSLSKEARKIVKKDLDTNQIRNARSFKRELNQVSSKGFGKDEISVLIGLVGEIKTPAASSEGKQIREEAYRNLVTSLKSSPDSLERLNAFGNLGILGGADLAFAEGSTHEGQDLLDFAKTSADLSQRKKPKLTSGEFARIAKEIATGSIATGTTSEVKVKSRDYLISGFNRLKSALPSESSARMKTLRDTKGQSFVQNSPLWKNPKVPSPAGIKFDTESLEALKQIENQIESGTWMQNFMVAAPLLGLLNTGPGLSGVADVLIFDWMQPIFGRFTDALGHALEEKKPVDWEQLKKSARKSDPWSFDSVTQDIPLVTLQACEKSAQDQAANLGNKQSSQVNIYWKSLQKYFAETIVQLPKIER